MLNHFYKGMAAGILISLGGGVFLSCEDKTVGALFFSVALVCICMLGYTLYTGKICYIAENCNKNGWAELLLGLLGNTVACVLCGIAIRQAVPAVAAAANNAVINRLENQEWWQTLIRGIFCGMLVYLSVEIYKKKNTPLGIILCIPTFILSGYEHSIADIFYFSAAKGLLGTYGFARYFGFLLLVVLGNSIGGLILPLLTKPLFKKES